MQFIKVKTLHKTLFLLYIIHIFILSFSQNSLGIYIDVVGLLASDFLCLLVSKSKVCLSRIAIKKCEQTNLPHFTWNAIAF